jgi:hypothetical protein
MKKLSLILGIYVTLAGCSSMDTNLESAQETRDANRDAYRQEFGCTVTDEHAAYRNCLLNTYYNSKPKTFSTYVNKEGKSVAVIKNESKESYDEDTKTYKTERVIVIETEERLVPVPVIVPNSEEVPVPERLEEKTIIEETKNIITETENTIAEVEPETIATETENTIAEVEPETIATETENTTAEIEPENIVTETEIITEEIPTKEDIIPVEPAPQKTWWDTYQEEKENEVSLEPVCPCMDPNDPCPQCVDK